MHMPYDENDAASAEELAERKRDAAPTEEEDPAPRKADEGAAPGLVDPRREGTPDYATPSAPPY